MPKPKARACFSTAHEHGRATLGHGTQSVRTHQNTSDRALALPAPPTTFPPRNPRFHPRHTGARFPSDFHR